MALSLRHLRGRASVCGPLFLSFQARKMAKMMTFSSSAPAFMPSSLETSSSYHPSAVAASTTGRPAFNLDRTMPPGYAAKVGHLQTFVLPEKVSGSAADWELGRALVAAWRADGILQIAMSNTQRSTAARAYVASKHFFARPHIEKAACVDPLSYAGYIASGEEITNGIADYSEIFTVTKDLPSEDTRGYIQSLGDSGTKLLQLTEMGLNVPEGSLTQLTRDGWHHLRVLRFPAASKTNGKGKKGRGIGSHTDYGLLVIASQDEVGGLFIRPPYKGEGFANWEKSAAGLREDHDGWVYVPPVPGVFTVFPGDILQYMTNSYLPSTPHKVGLNTRERFAFAYFHEPSFQATCRPLPGYDGGQTPREGIHYGTHFTNMFIRNYPDRITTRRLLEEGRYDMLTDDELRTMNA